MIAKASEQEPSLKFGELRDVLSPGHHIHDRRSRGRRSDLLKLPNNTALGHKVLLLLYDQNLC